MKCVPCTASRNVLGFTVLTVLDLSVLGLFVLGFIVGCLPFPLSALALVVRLPFSLSNQTSLWILVVIGIDLVF